MRAALLLGLAFVLAACTLPQKINRLEADKARYDRQRSENSVNERCNEEAMPGTTQHFACRLAGQAKTPPPAK